MPVCLFRGVLERNPPQGILKVWAKNCWIQLWLQWILSQVFAEAWLLFRAMGEQFLGCGKKGRNMSMSCSFSSLINSDLNFSSCFQALSLLLLRLFHFLAHWWTEFGHSSLNYFSFSKHLSHKTLCSFLLGNSFFPYCQDIVELFSLSLGMDGNSNPLLYRLQIAFITGRLKNSRGSFMNFNFIDPVQLFFSNASGFWTLSVLICGPLSKQ